MQVVKNIVFFALLLIGAVFFGFAIFAVASTQENQPLPWFAWSIGGFGALLLLSAISLFFEKKKCTLLLLSASTLFAFLRWVLNIKYVFPFGEIGKTGKVQPSAMIEIWQSQHFAIFLILALSLIFLLFYFRWRSPRKASSLGDSAA